jgi:hypothetical protein
LAIVMLALCRISDFLFVLRASQREPPAASSFSRSSSKYGYDSLRVDPELGTEVLYLVCLCSTPFSIGCARPRAV